MNSRVALTFVVAVAVLAYFWLSLDPPPAPTTTVDVPATAPPAVVAPPSPAEPGGDGAPPDRSAHSPPIGAQDRPEGPLPSGQGDVAGDGEASTVADDDDSAAGLGVRRPYPVDRDGIQGAMVSQLDAIRECYDAWVTKNPDIEGKLVLGFTIEPDEEAPDEAAVRGVEIKDGSTVDHLFLEGCVVSAVDELRFEAPRDGGVLTVNYPFMFSNE